MKKAYAILFVLLVTGCASMPVPRMEDTQTSAIGIQVEAQAPVGIFSNKPDRIFFVRIDGEGNIEQNQVIPSNFAKDGRIYLLNAKPGKYAAVAAFRSQAGSPFAPAPQPGISVSVSVGKTGYTTYFSKELIEATKVDVGHGEVTFMGSYVVKQSVGLTDAEPIQNHYAELIAPGSSKSGFGHLLSGDYHYRGAISEAERDEDAKTQFLRKAKDDLAEGGWGQIFK
ncbi:MAG: hypothetical protein HYS19_01780 [Nitrosomonadales bacterium]|nr:hypothetical protein [Nitrosomonadales bacterium]